MSGGVAAAPIVPHTVPPMSVRGSPARERSTDSLRVAGGHGKDFEAGAGAPKRRSAVVAAMARDDPTRTGSKLPRPAEAALDADAAAAEAMAPYENLPLLEPVADLGDQPQLRILCAATIAAGLAAGRRSGWGPRLAKAGLRMLVAHQLATAAKNFVKHRVDRTRPRSLHLPGKDHRISPGRNGEKEETSFPSGHASGAVAVARAFAREFPEHRAAAAAAGGALALVQVPRCAHYPTDIAAGAAIGLAAEAALALLWPAERAPENGPDRASECLAETELELSPCGSC